MSATSICLRPPREHDSGPDGDVWRKLKSPEQVVAVLTEPCEDGQCRHNHLVVARDRLGVHGTGSAWPQPSLADEFAALYPRPRYAFEPADWPTPQGYNEDLDIPTGPSPLVEKQQHAALLRSTVVVWHSGAAISPGGTATVPVSVKEDPVSADTASSAAAGSVVCGCGSCFAAFAVPIGQG